MSTQVSNNSSAAMTVLVWLSLLLGQGNAVLPGTWFPMGPAAIDDAQTYGSGRVEASGRATVMAVNPLNPQDVWLGTATGGVWYSTNAGMPGMEWRPMTDFQLSLATGALLLHDCNPTRCNQVYIGTGENNIRRHTYYGTGIIKATWSGVEFPSYSIVPYGTSADEFTGGAINNIIFDDSDLVVTVSEGRSSSQSQSTIQAPEPAAGYGIHRTTDNGATWNLVATSPAGALPTDLVKSPASGELFAGFMGQGIFKLTDGNKWCPLHSGAVLPVGCPDPIGLMTGLPPVDGTDPFDHIEIEWSPADNNVVYVAIGRCPSTAADDCVPDFYRSNDAGATWTQLAAVGNTGSIWSYTRYTHALRAHPSNADIITYGGLRLWKSEDGGATFQNMGEDTLHPDHQDVVYADPTGNTNLVYNANDGGFFFSSNHMSSWHSGNYDLQTVQFYSIAADTEQEGGGAIDTDVVIGGTQDNGVNMFYGSRKWDHVLDADGGDTAIHDANRMIGAMQRKAPYITSTGGALGNWNSYGGSQMTGPTAFYPPYLQHPISKVLFFATDRLYMRTVGDPSWTLVSGIFDDSETVYPLIETKNVISSVGLSRSDTSRVYIGHYDGAIWRSSAGWPCNNLACWVEIGGPNVGGDGLPNAVVSSIAVHPTDPDRVYVTYSGFNLPGHNTVYTNGNGGTGAWQQLSDGLPSNVPANVIKVDPDDPTQLWLGTDRGIFMKDGANSWDTWGPGGRLPNVPVYDLAIDNFRGRVYAGTFGRGAFVLTNDPAIYTFEGWMDGEIWDILLYGEGFVDSIAIDSCTVDILLQGGEICASGDTDAYSTAVVGIGGDGSLVTNNQFEWSGRAVIAACFNGNCVGDTQIEDCLADPDNLISSVRVTCGGQVAFASVSEECPQQDSPPSTVFAADGEGGGRRRLVEHSGGSFDVIVTLASTSADNGGDRVLCGVRVYYEMGQDFVTIGEAVVEAINNSSTCQDAGVQALHPLFKAPKRPEDFPDAIGELIVSAPDLTGGQLMLAFRGAPGQFPGLCFAVRSLGLTALKTLFMLQKRVTTSESGAAGGSLTFTQRSGQGTCTQTITTDPGDTPQVIAQKISDAFMNVVEPGTLECESRQNAYDMIAQDNLLLSVSTKALNICVEDAGVGIQVGPMDLDLNAVLLAPTAICQDVIVPAGSNCDADADINNGSFDPEDGFNVTLSYEPVGPYNLGDTEVTLTVTDNDGLTSSCNATVTVEDVTPPVIVSLWPSCLYPPNKKFFCLNEYGVNLSDNCPGTIDVSTECSSTQPEDSSSKSSKHDPDCVIGSLMDASTVCLRAERGKKEKNGRVYTLSINATDGAGNNAMLDVEVEVPKKKRGRACQRANRSNGSSKSSKSSPTGMMLGPMRSKKKRSKRKKRSM